MVEDYWSSKSMINRINRVDYSREKLFKRLFIKTRQMEQFYKKSKQKFTVSALIVLFAIFGFHSTFAQNHFTTVWQGENGQNHMNFIVVSALVEGLPMGVNDEIAVFSGTSCVGTSKLTQTLTAGTSSTYLFLKASLPVWRNFSSRSTPTAIRPSIRMSRMPS